MMTMQEEEQQEYSVIALLAKYKIPLTATRISELLGFDTRQTLNSLEKSKKIIYFVDELRKFSGYQIPKKIWIPTLNKGTTCQRIVNCIDGGITRRDAIIKALRLHYTKNNIRARISELETAGTIQDTKKYKKNREFRKCL